VAREGGLKASAEIVLHLLEAWLGGSLIGYERSYNGRVAGLRTMALVAVAAAAVASIAYAPSTLPGLYPGGAPRLDPTRLAQGVMTGLGFLGAGVIFKEGVNVQGLTTAAAIWITAAIGLLCGLGMEIAALTTVALTLVTLITMRWFEHLLPGRVFALATFRFAAETAPAEDAFRRLFDEEVIELKALSYAVTQEGRRFEYRVSLEAANPKAFRALAAQLRTVGGILEFELDRITK
jgi:putative Mg2+ transporter-C (MgtC) family protein